MQVDAGFDAAKGTSHVIHDVIDELIEIEDRRDLLRRFLKALQFVHLLVEHMVPCERVSCDDSWKCRHGSFVERTESVSTPTLRYRMPHSISRILSWSVKTYFARWMCAAS